MSGSQKGQGQGGEDPLFYMALFGILAVVVSLLVWKYESSVHYGLVWLRLRELDLLSLLTSSVDPARAWIRSTPVDLMTWETEAALASAAGRVIRWVAFPAVTIMAIAALFGRRRRAQGRLLKEELSLKRLIEVQSSVFGWIAPFARVNPTEAGFIEKHPTALQPLAWAKANGCLLENEGFDPELAKIAFAKQLTSPWQGVAGLPLHVRGLVAAFVLKAARQRSQCDDLLGRIGFAIARGFDKGASEAIAAYPGLALAIDTVLGIAKPTKGWKLYWRLVEIARKARIPLWAPLFGQACEHRLAFSEKAVAGERGEAWRIAARHHYAVTALLSIYQHAKAKGGILQPAYFNWLQYFDRGLWYPLQNQGGRAFHPEAAGVMAHWQAEKAFGHPIAIPAVSAAVEGMRESMSNGG